jgi:metal-responsive CopG/Arc/MetJ family transcriptional regulator
MQKQKVTISIARDRLSTLDRAARSRKSNRSALIEEALDTWEREARRRELAAGYRAMAEEDRRTAEDNLAAASQAGD